MCAAIVIAMPFALSGCAASVSQAQPAETAAEVTTPETSAPGAAPSTPYAVSGYIPRAAEIDPYERWSVQDVATVFPLEGSDFELDADRVLIVKRPEAEGRTFHPVAYLIYVLNALNAYGLTGEEEYLRRALATGEAVLEAGVRRDGALWFEYPFTFEFKGDPAETLTPPWRSGMAQGQALSAFSRLYALTHDEKWLRGAEEVFPSLTSGPASQKSAARVDDDGHLWFEEYLGIEPKHVVNGHIYALYGLADYYLLTGDPRASDLFDAGATTIRETFDDWRVVGGLSYYCAARYCKDAEFHPAAYHRGVTAQLVTLASMTRDERFQSQAELLAADYRASGATG